MKSNLYLGSRSREGVRAAGVRLSGTSIPVEGIVCDASCFDFIGSKENDGYFHGKTEWRCVDLSTGEILFESAVLPEATINIGEFMAIVTSLRILHDRGDASSPVWSDSKLCIGWVNGRYTSSRLPMNEFTWEALDAMEEALAWLNRVRPKNRVLWWDKRVMGENPADYGRK